MKHSSLINHERRFIGLVRQPLQDIFIEKIVYMLMKRKYNN